MAGPTYHARTHLPGGTDPLEFVALPCVGTITPFYDKIAEIAAGGATLLGYWRLGESSGDFLDTSGNPTTGAPSPMIVRTGTATITREVTGALASGDDGAVQFNADNNASGEHLRAEQETYWDTETQPLSVVGFLKPFASASTFYGLAFGRFNAFSGLGGYGILVSWPTREVLWARAQAAGASGVEYEEVSGGSLAADEWAFVVGTFSGVGVDGGRLRLYINGAFVDEVAADFNINDTEAAPTIGRSNVAYSSFSSAPQPGTFYGAADEVSIWQTELTAAQIAGLYQSSVGTPAAPSGSVPVSDGACGYAWSTPQIQTYVNGADMDSAAGVDLVEGAGITIDKTMTTVDGDPVAVYEIAATVAEKLIELKVFDDATNITTGNGKLIFCVPLALNGFDLTAAAAFNTTAGTSTGTTVMIRNVTQAADMLSTAITIDTGEFTSYTAATPPVVDTGNDDVATGDLIAIDVDAVPTAAKGLGVILTFSQP